MIETNTEYNEQEKKKGSDFMWQEWMENVSLDGERRELNENR